MKVLHSLRGLSWLLGIPLDELRKLAARPDFHYKPFTTRKGKKARQIDNPKAWLKLVQRTIRRRILLLHPVDDSVRACVKGGSPLKHALAVSGKKYVAETDLKNCYPSITSAMAYRLYLAIGFGVRNASILTRLTTWKGHLPQGAPTSDMIANLVLRAIDERAKAIADARGLTYSRCMDGFVVAGNKHTGEALGLIIQEILKSGLAVRRKKTRNAGNGFAQIVAGYNVNTPHGPKVRKDKVQEIRTDVFQLVQARSRGEDVSDRLRSVRGSLSYLRTTNPGHVRRLERQMAAASISYR